MGHRLQDQSAGGGEGESAKQRRDGMPGPCSVVSREIRRNEMKLQQRSMNEIMAR